MIIPSTITKLDYNPAKDILFVEWPDIHSYTLSEVNYTLTEILDTIRYYDVKKLLIDSRETVIGISSEDYTALAIQFVKELMATRLKKVARLESYSSLRESQVQEISKVKTFIAFKNFTDTEAALSWLSF